MLLSKIKNYVLRSKTEQLFTTSYKNAEDISDVQHGKHCS